MKRIISFLFAVCLIVGAADYAQAQACAVTVSIATSATASTACFVPRNGQVYAQLTGSWVGTVNVDESTNGGIAWTHLESSTANTTFKLAPAAYDRAVRVFFNSRTSGTLTGALTYNPTTGTRIKYSSVPIGSVTYSSFGSSVSVAFSTSIEIADLIIPAPFYATGIAVLAGATTGTNTEILYLYDATGGLIANTTLSGTTVGSVAGANAFEAIAFAGGSMTLPAGRYYCGLQMSGVTDKYRAITTSTFVDVVASTLTGAAYGTTTPVIVPPTTFTTNVGPICYVY